MWCWYLAKRVLANLGSPRHCWNVSPAEPHTRLRYFCSPQHTDSALYPIISQMERAAGLAHDDTPQAKLDKIDALLAQNFTSKQDVALFAEMLSLRNDGRYPALDLVPQQRRQKTLEALTSQLAGLASQHPVLMVFEDAHWIDPTSLELLGRNRTQTALTRINEALAFVSETGEHWTDAFLQRIRGNILLKGDLASTLPAEEAFRTAIAIAQQQKAHSFELRAAMSMARLWRDQGKPQQARELLAPVYGWFTEGFDTRDLKEAKALLEELVAS